MARNNSLQIQQVTQITQGGYGRNGNSPLFACSGCVTGGCCQTGNCNLVEEIDGNCGYIDIAKGWNAADDSGSTTRTYTWRDTNTGRSIGGVWTGYNANSARGNVEIRDEWTSYIDDMNNLIVDVTSTVVKVWRDDIRPRTTGHRQIAVLEEGNYPTSQNGNHLIRLLDAVNIATFQNPDNPWWLNVSRSRRIVISPQTDSFNYMPFRIRNWTVGYAGMNWGSQPYVDEMLVGTAFRNSLPNQFDPPELVHIDQTPRICDSVVDALACFKAPILNGSNLVIQWHYEGQDWSTSRQASVPADRNAEEVCVNMQGLIPTTCSPTKVWWRAQFVPIVSTLRPSEWTYGEFETVFVPPVWMNVPDISAAECSTVGRGELLSEFEEVVYYNGQKPECKKGNC